MNILIEIAFGAYIGTSLKSMRTFSKRLKAQTDKLDQLLNEIQKYR